MTSIALWGGLAALPSMAQDAVLGRNLAATCANCHGITGLAVSDMKPLAGVPRARLMTLMADFKSGEQPATVMNQIARGYTDEQLGLIAAYFESQEPRTPRDRK